MGGNVENNPSNKGLTPETARVLNDTYGITKKSELKAQIKSKLAEMLSNGQITEEQAKEAKKFLKSDNVIQALLGRNTAMVSNEKGTLLNDDANKLLADAGLTVEDLFNTVAKYIGEDWTLSYTHLSKSEKKDADEGKITSSELINIQNELNKIIKDNGGDYELTPKETKKLIDGLGIPIDKTINVPKILLTILSFGLAGTITGFLTGGSKATAVATSTVKVPEGFVADPVVATASTSGGLAGLAAGGVSAFIVATIQVLRDIFRHEKPYGEQGGEAGGVGTTTNKTESKMHQMKVLAEGETTSTNNDEQTLNKRILPPDDSYMDANGVEHKVVYSNYNNKIIIKNDMTSDNEQYTNKRTYFDENNNIKRIDETLETDDFETLTVYDSDGNKRASLKTVYDTGETIYLDENDNEIDIDTFDMIPNKLLE